MGRACLLVPCSAARVKRLAMALLSRLWIFALLFLIGVGFVLYIWIGEIELFSIQFSNSRMTALETDGGNVTLVPCAERVATTTTMEAVYTPPPLYYVTQRVVVDEGYG